jgi:hypothetical protein
LRAEIGYALAEDTLGLGRFRERYAPKMAQTPDARAFDIVSAPPGSSGEEFAAIAHAAAAGDTLEGFLRDMKAHYPDGGAPAPMVAAPGAAASGPAASALPPQTRPAVPDLPPVPPARASGRTAQR